MCVLSVPCHAGYARKAGWFQCAAGSAIPLPAPAVERHGFERTDIDALEAPHIDRDHRRAVGLGAVREGFDTTDRAELVVNDLLVELILGEILGAGAQRKLLRRDKGEEKPMFCADGAVAGHDL